MTERILVPFDDSEPARRALEEALELFESNDIVVLNVIDSSELTGGVEGAAAENLMETREEAARELFQEARSTADEYGVSLETVVETGDPAGKILEVTEATDADHIVMGSHGRTGLSRILVGSVAEEVIREAPVSVTISRPDRTTGD